VHKAVKGAAKKAGPIIPVVVLSLLVIGMGGLAVGQDP